MTQSTGVANGLAATCTVGSPTSVLVAVVLVVYVAAVLWWWDALLRIRIFVRRNVLGNQKNPRLPPGGMGYPFVGELPYILLSRDADKLGAYKARRAKRHGEIYCGSVPPFMKCAIQVNSEEAVKWVLSKENRGLEGEWDVATSSLLGQHAVAVLTGEAHKRMRFALMPVFQTAYLREYVTSLNGIVRDHLQEHWSPCNAGESTRRICTRDYIKSVTFDIIANLVIGLDLDKDHADIVALNRSFFVWLKGLFMPTIKFPGSPYVSALKARENVRSIILGVVRRRRMSTVAAQRDVLALLLQPQKTDTGEDIILSDDEISDNLLNLLFAGSDTSTCTMSWVIRRLNENPAVLARLREEHVALRASRKDPTVTQHITWDEMQSLRYTNQVIFEVMRMTTPVVGAFRRAKEDLVYKGYLIPKGYTIGLDYQTMMQNPEYHEARSTFDPDRFESNQATGGLSKPGFMPFGGGARMCLGFRLAIAEMNVLIHHIVLGYSWTAAPETKDDVSYFPIPMQVDGVPIDVKKLDNNDPGAVSSSTP